jgi:glycosyltransferase involved in cell wall biosynthesis
MEAISVGWLRWEKGHEYALEAVRAARDRGVPLRLQMLGALPDEWLARPMELERIRHTISDLDLDGHVHMAGAASSAEVVRRLVRSDVLLHAAVTEGMPSAILEAMACGVPVVASDCSGVTEAVADGVAGFVVPPRDPGALADALAALWRDPDLRARMGGAGRAQVLARHTLEHEHGNFLMLYREVVAA